MLDDDAVRAVLTTLNPRCPRRPPPRTDPRPGRPRHQADWSLEGPVPIPEPLSQVRGWFAVW